MNATFLYRSLGRSHIRTTRYQSQRDIVLTLEDFRGITGRTHVGDHALWLDENQYDTRYGQGRIY